MSYPCAAHHDSWAPIRGECSLCVSLERDALKAERDRLRILATAVVKAPDSASLTRAMDRLEGALIGVVPSAEAPACICAEYDGKGLSTCGAPCPVHGTRENSRCLSKNGGDIQCVLDADHPGKKHRAHGFYGVGDLEWEDGTREGR